MCGIAGIIDNTGIQPSDLIKMSEAIQHRGPDDEGFLLLDSENKSISCKGKDSIAEVNTLPHISGISERFQLGLLHRRLSILDLSPAGHQPMSYNNLSITYNGEVYNYKEIRAELAAKGHQFKSDSDTEVILASYKEWGKDCVSRFVGMWAFAIVDSSNNRVFLSRDRFGIKPLYYFAIKEKFAFASEIKALLALPFVGSKADQTAVLEYLSFGATNDTSRCLFENIEVVQPSQNIFVDIKTLKLTKEKYYDLEQQVSSMSVNDKSALNGFRNLLENAVDLHLRSDVPVGTCLSGGLDSSAIVSFAAKKTSGNTFKTFTASYKDPKINESDYAKMVSDSFTNIQASYTYPNFEDYWKDLDKLIWHQDLPIHSASVYAQWEVMKLVGREKTKVVINGQGADEILGGYYHFAGIYLIELLKKGRLISFAHEFSKAGENFTPTVMNDIGRALFYFLPATFQHMIRKEKRLGPGFISDQYKLASDAPRRAGKTFRESSIANINYGLQDLLRYEDRNSMAFSVESRVPFLDHRLVEYSIALNNEWKVKDGWSKYILRKTVENSLPKEVVWRKNKMGFVTPHGEWKSKLKKELTDYISSANCPDLINKEYLLKLCSADMVNTNHLSEFWKVISFIKWTEVFKVRF